jgi:hypothetical protein
VADAETLDALGELLAHGPRTPRDHVALLEVLRPVERLADLPGLRADLGPDAGLQRLQRPVTGRFGEALPDVEAFLVEVVHVGGVEALGLAVAVGHAHELEESRTVRVVVGAELADRVPETVHRGLPPLVAEIREVAVDVVELCRPLPRLEAPTPGDPHGRMRRLQRLGPDVHVADLRVLAVECEDLGPRPRLEDQVVGFVVPIAERRRVDPVGEVHVHRGAHREAGDEPTSRQDVEHRELFGDAQRRVVGGEAVAEHHERRAGRPARQRRGHEVRRRHEAVGVVVVLVHAQAIEALRLGELELVEELVVQPPRLLRVVEAVRDVDPHRAVARLEVVWQEPIRHEVEEADFHWPPAIVARIIPRAGRVSVRSETFGCAPSGSGQGWLSAGSPHVYSTATSHERPLTV